MNEDEENDEFQGGDSAATPVVEDLFPMPTLSSSHSREEPPPPIGPKLNQKTILLESLDIISENLKKINEQKHYLASLGYMMHSLQRLLDSGREHEERLNAFLVNDDKLQTQWFLAYHKLLPPYSDYLLVLKNVPDVVSVNQIDRPIKESVLRELAEDVEHGMYAGGLQVKAQRQMDLKLNSKMDLLREFTHKEAFPFYSWLSMIARELGHEETLENKFFEISSFVDFLNHSSSISETE